MKNRLVSARLFASVLIFILLAGHAQSQALIEKTFSNNVKIQVYQSTQLSNGDFVFTAAAYPASFDSSMALLIKTDSLLQVKWIKRYKVFHKDLFRTIKESLDGKLFIAGSAREDFNQQSGGSVMKCDTAGNILWHRVYSDSYDDGVICVSENADSSLMIFNRQGVSNYPVKIIYADKSGNINSWRTFYIGNIALNGPVTGADDNYYMAGIYQYPGITANSLFVCSFTSTAFKWIKEFQFGRNINTESIALLTDGKIGVAGNIADIIFPNTQNAWVMKLDTTGNIIYAYEYGQQQAYNESVWKVIPAENGSMVLAGQANTPSGAQALAFKVSNNGSVQFCKSYGNLAYQYFYDGFVLNDGRLLLNGSDFNLTYSAIVSSDGTSACNSSNRTFLTATMQPVIVNPVVTVNTLLKTPVSPALNITSFTVNENLLCSGTVGLPEMNVYENGITIFPNPVSQILNINIKATSPEPMLFEIYDLTGRMVMTTEKVSIDVSGIAEGLYLLKVKTRNQSTLKKFQIIR